MCLRTIESKRITNPENNMCRIANPTQRITTRTFTTTGPIIGHLKADHRLCRNFYAGVFGDNINVMLAAAGFNFKRAMRILCPLLKRLFPHFRYIILQKPKLLLRVWKPAATMPVWAF